MSLAKRHLFTISIVTILLAVNLVALRWSSLFLHDRNRRPLLKYGEMMPQLEGHSLSGGKRVELSPSRSNLVIYLSPSQKLGNSIELVKYAEILSQRHQKDGLSITVITRTSTSDLTDLVEHSLINYDVLLDSDGQMGERLGLAGGANGVFLFDRAGRCLFTTRAPVRTDDLRQIVATEVLHADPSENADFKQQAIGEGNRLGSWTLVNARSWEQTSLEKIGSASPKLFIFFTADCSVCSLPGYLEKFSVAERSHQSKLAQGQDAVLIFDFNFSRTDVLEQLDAHHISSPAYISREELSAVTELGKTEALEDEEVIAVQTDSQRNILRIAPLSSLGSPDKSAASSTLHQAAADTNQSLFEPAFRNIPLSAYDVATHGGKYFVTDFKSNSVLIINEKMEVGGGIGRIGSGPGRLFRPGGIDVASDGTIFVEDGGNQRVEQFNENGNYVGEFPTTNHEGFAVGKQKEVYLGQPEEGHLITVYSATGKKLRSFGQLKKFSQEYGPTFAEQDDQYAVAVNRVRLSVDGHGDLYVSFMLLPLLQKYSPDGKLLFERRIEGTEIDELKEAIRRSKYLSTGRDGVDARIIALDPVIDQAGEHIFVPLIDGSVYVADMSGRRLCLLHPQVQLKSGQTFYPFIAGLGARGELLVTPFPPKHWYKLVTPTGNMCGGAVQVAESIPKNN
jgi:hypothetical protein